MKAQKMRTGSCCSLQGARAVRSLTWRYKTIALAFLIKLLIFFFLSFCFFFFFSFSFSFPFSFRFPPQICWSAARQQMFLAERPAYEKIIASQHVLKPGTTVPEFFDLVRQCHCNGQADIIKASGRCFYASSCSYFVSFFSNRWCCRPVGPTNVWPFTRRGRKCARSLT